MAMDERIKSLLKLAHEIRVISYSVSYSFQAPLRMRADEIVRLALDLGISLAKVEKVRATTPRTSRRNGKSEAIAGFYGICDSCREWFKELFNLRDRVDCLCSDCLNFYIATGRYKGVIRRRSDWEKNAREEPFQAI